MTETMPVAVEPPEGGEPYVVFIRDHVDAAWLLARGFRFPHSELCVVSDA